MGLFKNTSNFMTLLFVCISISILLQVNSSNGQFYDDGDCLETEFKCSDRCIDRDNVCDGHADCDYGEDEENCKLECAENEFMCDDNTCIEESRRCDRVVDCTEGEDEEQCDNNCGKDQWMCDYGECIPLIKHCDGSIDCSDDSSDERNCGDLVDCSPSQFRCDSGHCIKKELRCNGIQDCFDYSDERKCSQCTKDTFKCKNGACIQKSLRCDGRRHCNDGSDEEHCDKSDLKYCMPEEFACRNGQCVPKEVVCDNVLDCDNGDDELNCSCKSNEFKCMIGGGCWPKSKVCDGHFDCWDKSDENNCPNKNLNHPSRFTCNPDEFQCSDGICISGYKRCNGIIDCLDRTDENDCSVKTYENFYDDDDEDEENICNDNEFSCDHDKCILQSQICDGTVDCDDRTDELNCRGEEQANCASHEFQCRNGLCIHSDDKCNGYKDCIDGSDEERCSQCQSGAFHCRSGECILEEKRCDRVHDCNDLSDEIGCVYHCKSGEFQCNDGLCIDQRRLCDGIRNCRDGSDENPDNCQVDYDTNFASTRKPAEPCGAGEWQCDNDECINVEFVCDGASDCLDNSDEGSICKGTDRTPEVVTCEEDEMLCDNRCLDISRKCDGYPDCADGLDETDCDEIYQPTPKPLVCSEHKCPNEEKCFQESQRCDGRWDCNNGYDEEGCRICEENDFHCSTNEICIDVQLRCDGFYDCKDFSDEQNCFEPSCRANEFQCNDGQCIADYRKCDGTSNCRDGSDEYGCPERDSQRGCSHDQWQCTSGECISMHSFCDNIPDCRDFSDEQNCNEEGRACFQNMFRCENGPCIHESLRCNGIVNCPYDISDELDCHQHFNYYNQQQPTHPATESPRLNLKTYPNEQIIKERQVREGREVVFQCRDEGPIRARVRWMRAGGTPLPIGSRDVSGRLEIPNIRMEHAGEYVCEAVGYAPSTPNSQVYVQLTVEKYDPIIDRPSTACSVNEATCMNGDCIPKHKLCDGVYDCNDGSDESSCSNIHGCEPNEFKCRNNKCVLKTWRCDGQNDCEDNSDEESCATLPPDARCRFDEYQCSSGQCVPKSFQCDTHPDCLDNSDEIGCAAPTVAQPPPPMITLQPGSVFNITCRAVGVPVPLIVWRLNWGHIPEKCMTTSENGYGVLTCPNIEVRDSGAYSCEIINSMGTHFVTPDTILIVNGNGSVCERGYFNDKADRPEECINCFCFGVSTQCTSANLFTYTLPAPATSLTVVGVTGPWMGSREITISDFKNHDLIATRHGIQLRLSNIPLSTELAYYSLPDDFKGNQLKSYGGSLKYEVEYSGYGSSNQAPDVILTGNGYTLQYRSNARIEEAIRNPVAVDFTPGNWYNSDGRSASREEIMMVLANIENLLIKLQYVDREQREIELLNIYMDSAAIRDMGLGSASLVEECRCPVGYVGLSCENCAHGYVRQQTGAWLGRCVREEEPCKPGTYGDPNRGIPCRPCPCPLTTSGNQFARTCSLGSDGEVICNCERGYVGRRCEECDRGFTGNPVEPGGSCQQARITDCNPLGTYRERSDGSCECKEFVTGRNCDQCKVDSFNLNANSATGCIDCFCMGVTKTCTSSSWYRDVVRSTFSSSRNEFAIITDYENPDEVPIGIQVSSSEVSFRGSSSDSNIYYWRLPSRFAGNKISAYGGDLNYTIRYIPTPGGGFSRNNAPDVVIRSENDITILHYRRDDISPSGSQTYVVPIFEGSWQRSDGNIVNREHLLMALADVSDIFIKATYTTTTEEAALSHVSLDIASPQQSISYIRALEVEQCACPPGHQGLSCEDCAPGFTRSQGGIYLGLCEPCNCNGHSEECDAETGECIGCRDNTEGPNCEECKPGFDGNATAGTRYDCSPDADESHRCDQCDYRGYISCETSCVCKSNVGGYRCDQCREGTFNLQQNNPVGCSECFCSGATKTCSSSHLYRQQIPMIIFDDKFTLTNRAGEKQIDEDAIMDLSTNRLTYSLRDAETYFWSLPTRFLGNQILSYGGNLTFTLTNDGYGNYVDDQDVIITGNGLTLFWSRSRFSGEGTSSVSLTESNWQSIDRNGPRPATHSDLLTVLSNIQSILIRATVKEMVSDTHISDVFLDTAVQQHTGQSSVDEIEVCRCPKGYRGTSCESCDHFYYRDTFDRSIGLLGACKRCPCSDNAESCTLENDRRVTCTCKPGYYGRSCETSEPPTPSPPTRPPQRPPTISVIISSPILQIVDVGKTVRVSCKGFHKTTMIPIRVRWMKQDGRLPETAYEDKGQLIISNIQYDDSGIYICQAQSGEEIVEEFVTITVSQGETQPKVTLSPTHVDVREYSVSEVQCQSSGATPLIYYWDRLDSAMSRDVSIDGGYLRFNSIRKSDEGEYRCRASNVYGEDSQVLHVFVEATRPTPPPLQPNYVTISPPSFNGRPGDMVRLTCTSQRPSTIAWIKDGAQTLPYNVFVDRGVLTIENARVEDSGRYTCKSIDQYTGQTSSSDADVYIQFHEVKNPPVIKQFEDFYNVIQGQDFSLNCEVSGNPYPKVKWTKVHESFESNVQQNGNILRILNAKPANRGVYTCIAESDGGSTEASTVIDVEPREAPVLELHPREPQTIRVGESAMLSCRAIAGIPSPTITWRRRDRRPLSSRVKEEYMGTITLRDVTIEDDGEYECHAENIAGTVSMTSSLNVQQPPIMTINPNVTEYTVTEGDELKLECSATGIPLPNVQWQEPYPQTIAVAGFGPPSARGSHTPYAIIHKYNARKSNEGTYICTAENAAGREDRYILVLVKPKRGDIGSGDIDVPRPDPDYPPYPQPDVPTTRHQYTVAVGDRSEVSCQIQETNKPTSWRRMDGSPLPRGSHSNGGVLYIDTTTREAAGLYECVVHEGSSQYAIVVTEIIVIELPRITFSPPMPMTVRNGENVVILCNVTGEEPIRVHWHSENHRPLNANINVRGNLLEFYRITLRDAGRYYCTATNMHGNVTKVAEVIVNRNEITNNRPDQQGSVQEVVEGETVGLDCHFPYDQQGSVRIQWHRENGDIPSTAQYENNRLILHRIRDEDAGRYICQMRTQHDVTENYVDVTIKRYNNVMNTHCTPNEFHCKTHPRTCINYSMVCDGIYDCLDHSDEMDCYHRRRSKKEGATSTSKHREAEALPFLKLDPSRSFLRPGESITVACTSSEGMNTPVVWERHGGHRLQQNFWQEGNRLVISNAESRDAGRYTCKCYTRDGQLYASEYELNIEEKPMKNEVRPPKVEHADVGSTVVLRCNSHKYPAKFHWARQHGKFAPGQDISSSELRLVDVQAKDAGTYICTASHNGHTIDIPTTLVVVGAIPYFPQAPKSYMVFPKLDEAYVKFNFEITFKPQRGDGLILYNGQNRGPGDYIALSLNNGYPEFRFDFGNAPTITRAEKPIELGKWHTIKVNRLRRDGFMLIDDQPPVAFPPTSILGLDLAENLYLGGVANFDEIAPSAVATKEGFVGCISRLIIKDHELMLNQDSIYVEGVTSCEPCADEPCQNDGVCLESQSEQGYTCVCQSGYTGRNCAIEGDSCTPGICGVGRCEDTDMGMECYCPMNKTGDRCQYIEHLDESNLSFKDGSYAAYKTPKSTKLNIKFQVRPDNNHDGVILYVAESDLTAGDFAAVIIKDKHYEFRINTLAKVHPVIIRSVKPVEVNKWSEITIGRRQGEGYLIVDDQPQVIGKTAGPGRSMFLKTHLYIGGYDKRILFNKGVNVTRGFDGCISNLEVSSQKVDMVQDMLDSANVQNCGDANEVIPGSDDECKIGSKNCGKVKEDICLRDEPCENGGICINTGDDSYTCDCPVGFTGDNCQYSDQITIGGHFKGNGYIELNRSTIVKSSTEKDILIAILFSTTSPNGLLVWYGQSNGEAYNGQDFVAMAIVDGLVEFSFRLNSEESMIKHLDPRVDNGARHVAILRRNGNQAALELDGLTSYGESRPTDKQQSYLPGHIFLGGAPDITNFTGNRYTQGFNGCIHVVEGSSDGSINLGRNAISGYNVDTCPDSGEVVDLGTEPPLA